MIEQIGKRQKNERGSDIAKGIRLLKYKLQRKNFSCSTRAIKRAMRVYPKLCNHDYKKLGINVFYFHKEWSGEIIKTAMEMIEDQGDITLSKDFYVSRMGQLWWVHTENYKGQGEDAGKLHAEISKYLP